MSWNCKVCGSKIVTVLTSVELDDDGEYDCCESSHRGFLCDACGAIGEFIDDIAEMDLEKINM